jgi:hypothetical protein
MQCRNFDERQRGWIRGLLLIPLCREDFVQALAKQEDAKTGTAQLSGGKAKFTISTLAVGSTKVAATYYGNSNIAKSSASVTQTVR